MNTTTTTTTNFPAVKKVLWQVLWLNLFVALLKIGVGLVSGLLSMVADGFHSLMDTSSNVVGLIALRIAQAPPDRNHPYGHRKAETMAAFVIGIFLLLAAYEILSNAIQRLSAGTTPQANIVTFVVMGVTITVNLLVSLYEDRRGKALGSEILQADAVHTRSDLWVSLSVVVGLVGVSLGWPWLDAGVGLVIALIIGLSALKILRQATNVFMDRATLPSDAIEQLAMTVPGVESVERVRSRGRTDESYVDLHVRVRRDTPTDQAHSIAHAVQYEIRAAYPQATDVTIHIEPEQEPHVDHDDITGQLRAIARSLGGSIHEIWMHSFEGKHYVDLHLEVPPELSLAEAHHLATHLEERGEAALPTVAEITTHIEPMGEAVAEAVLLEDDTVSRLKNQALTLADSICGEGACHHPQIWTRPGGFALSMHCTLPPSISIVEAHAISEQVEARLRQKMPQLKRVMIHVEPSTKAAGTAAPPRNGNTAGW